MLQNMRLQADNEFQQVKIKDLNDKYKRYHVCDKCLWQKSLSCWTKNKSIQKGNIESKNNISPTTIIKHSSENMNSVKSEKYKLTPNKIEKKSLENQWFRTKFNFEHIKI